jgi:photosystem II stability/assembly factor-like uncharacterized protein
VLKILLVISALLASIQIYTQSPEWHVLSNAPSITTGKIDDVFFINPNTGWTFTVNQFSSNVYRTTSGGASWDTLFKSGQPAITYRSMGFFNSQIGVIGTLSPGKELYRTSNGGINWIQITAHPTIPAGICGISILNELTAFGCGAYTGNARIIKTSNAGLSWDSLTTDTSQVRSLIDCHYFSQDTGIVVGGYRTSGTFTNSSAVVLITTNGGVSWQRSHITNRSGEWCWKISFVSRNVGFVSVERFNGMSYILKTTNGGFNWSEIPFMVYDQEGIGFINENTGWVGGFTNPTYKTTNGGNTWIPDSWGMTINRFRFLSDTLGYASGRTIYKFTREPIGIQQTSTEVPKGFLMHQNHPNPFNPQTNIKFEIPKSSFVTIKVFDALGREIETIANENLNAGIYKVSWDASLYPSGIYFYKIISQEYSESKKMILIK